MEGGAGFCLCPLFVPWAVLAAVGSPDEGVDTRDSENEANVEGSPGVKMGLFDFTECSSS